MKLSAIIGVVIVMLGIILIYDARHITKKLFSFSDLNEGAFALKLIGFIMSIIGSSLILLA